jgi:hypothetical protein
MSAQRPRRLERRGTAVENLLREARIDGHAGTEALAAILAAAAAPGRESELAGEGAALAAFRELRDGPAPGGDAAYPETVGAPVPSGPAVVRWLPGRRSTRMAVGAAVAACAASVAVAFGVLPDDGPRHHGALGRGPGGPPHHVTAPTHPTARPRSGPPRAGGTSDNPGPPATTAPPVSTSPPAPLLASPGPGTVRPSAATTEILTLCRAYLSSGADPAAVPPAGLRRLERAAGGDDRIKGYCEHAIAIEEQGLPGG